ncbi:MAG: hypothetical protein LH475_03265 [Cryobacterium sp.]|uniref:hypothetical protein n=1 Tax=unclassified Cryobacterium TaxID=2649013 RepID=UPI0018CB5E6D|nr:MULTISPECIES: hypothetical protein [unclassified Cryobacterium]MCY7403643.1 hypothetical protein [Cryobacterium sp.]MEC5155630.1 hypothetical protein [Cryobacterium sp. CAN_C3]
MEASQVAQELALADDLRIRGLRRGNVLVVFGSLSFVGAWLTLPLGVYLLMTVANSAGSLGLVAGGIILLAVSVLLAVSGVQALKQSLRKHATVTAFGKANPAFGEDRKNLPTGGVPLSWIGNVAGS